MLLWSKIFQYLLYLFTDSNQNLQLIYVLVSICDIVMLNPVVSAISFLRLRLDLGTTLPSKPGVRFGEAYILQENCLGLGTYTYENVILVILEKKQEQGYYQSS